MKPSILRVAKFVAVILAMFATAGCAKLSDQTALGSAVIPGSQQDFSVSAGDRGSLETDSSELSVRRARCSTIAAILARSRTTMAA
jgi:uncharacterized membrane protein YhhN